MRNIWLVLLLMASGVAQAASFDCAKAKTPQEKAICASPELSAADEDMATAYRAVLKSTPPEMVAAVREGQRQWLRSIAITCADRKDAIPGLMEECLKQEYRDRTDVLRGSLVWREGIQFVWRSVTLTASDDPESAQNDRERGVLSDHGTLNASWPQANNKSPEWQAWNVAMEDAVRNMVSNRAQPGGGWKLEWAVDRDTDVTVRIGFVGQELVTATLTNQWYGHGAAHPNTGSIQFNWLLKEKRELRPEDVFRPDSGWDRTIYTHCNKDLQMQLGEDYQKTRQPSDMMSKELNAIIANPHNWKLDGEGLSIMFGRYSVSCYACPVIPVTVPWETLQPFLQKRFVIPE